MAKLFKHHFMVVAPTVTEDGYIRRACWDYGTFIIDTRFWHNAMTEIAVKDPKDSDNCLVSFWVKKNDSGVKSLTDSECASLTSGVKEVAEAALYNVFRRLLRQVNETRDVLQLIDPK